jgi:hypothetical protein
MHVERSTQVKVVLTLDEAEATWLNRLMQNTLHGQDLASESLEDALMRNKFFHATIIS